MTKNFCYLFLFFFCALSLFASFYLEGADEQQTSVLNALEKTALEEGEGMSHFFLEFLNMLFALGLIIVLLLLFAWFGKRMLNGRIQQINRSSTIKILEKRALSPKSTLYLLEILDKGIVIAESPAGIKAITEFPAGTLLPKDVESDPSPFAKILKEKMK